MQPLDPDPRPLDHLTLRGRGRGGDAALADRAGVMSYDELELAVGRLASALRRLVPNAGDRVASWLPKNRLACVLPLAAARAGLVHVPINPVLRRAQAEHILSDSGAALLIANAARAASLEDAPVACRIVDDAEATFWTSGGEGLAPSSHDPQALAALLYTSGSTGQPKGVMLSHANMWLGAVSVAHYLGLVPTDRTLAVLPLAFDYGQSQLLSAWAAGASVTPLDYLTARDVVNAVARHDVTTLAGVPPLWIQLAEAQWPDEVRHRIRRITNSGGAMPRALLDRLRTLFPAAEIHLMYGLTEAFRSTSLDPTRIDHDAHTVGRAIPFAEVLIVGPDGATTADGEVGELVHAGPLVSGGYWRDSERTAARFKPAPPASTYGGVAVWSGDRARRDHEGLITILGRDDEMIKTSGNRVSPGEIEEAAMASGAVAEAAAFGIPDERLGQAIALVARAAGEPADAEIRLRLWLSRELPAHMQPRVVHWRDALPIGPNGKFDRASLARELAA